MDELRQITMSAKDIWITERDKKRLNTLLRDIRELERTGGLSELETQLNQAKVVRSNEIPPNIVTMNCVVRLRDIDTQNETDCWLRFSAEIMSPARAVPILSELGTALLGSREGDTVEWSDGSRKRRSMIVEIIYQPERLGNYEL